jgi:hypothetical protein
MLTGRHMVREGKTHSFFEEKTTLKVIPELCTEQSNGRYSSADAK